MGGSSREGEELGLFGSLYSWGISLVDYAQNQLSNLLVTENLEIVNPESNEVEKAESLINPNDRRQQMWRNFEQYIGRDVTSLISVPVWIMEPFTVLQKMSEIMEYTELLDKADKITDPHERLAYMTAFAITPYGTSERPWKPFNPILGETFELQCGNEVKFLAEQVSHHPPIAAAHGENDHFTYNIISAPRSKFLGNSVEIYPNGRSHIKLKSTGEVFSILPPVSKACNIVIGRTWIDSYGTLSVTNTATGDKAVVEFMPCGWFNTGRYEFDGFVIDGKSGNKVMRIYGLWNSHCDMVRVKEVQQRGEMEEEEEEEEEQTDEDEIEEIGEVRRLWTCKEKPDGDAYGRSYFCLKCMSDKNIVEPLLTDSRRRPDVVALARGQSYEAGNWKSKLEEMQRAEKQYREEKMKEQWKPQWFRPLTNTDPEAIVYDGEYTFENVPCFEWTGKFFRRENSNTISNSDSILGKGFSPWRYPELHVEEG